MLPCKSEICIFGAASGARRVMVCASKCRKSKSCLLYVVTWECTSQPNDHTAGAAICPLHRTASEKPPCRIAWSERPSCPQLISLKTQRSQNTCVSDHKRIDRHTLLNTAFGGRRGPAAYASLAFRGR